VQQHWVLVVRCWNTLGQPGAVAFEQCFGGGASVGKAIQEPRVVFVGLILDTLRCDDRFSALETDETVAFFM